MNGSNVRLGEAGDECSVCARDLEGLMGVEDRERYVCPTCWLAVRGTARICAMCGAPLTGYANRKTCSVRCRVALHRSRRAA